MYILHSSPLLLALSAAVMTAVSAVNTVSTVPIKTLRNPKHLNANSLTRRYFQKRDGVSSSSPLTNIENDVIYTVPLQLGTPPQSFNVAIDTGSPITWISSSNCTGSGCDNSTRFDCSASSTCKPISNGGFNASYVSGQGVIGNYASETFTLGSLKFTGVAGLVTENDAQFPADVDGLMGLWYYAAEGDVPILNVLQSSAALVNNMIGIWLETSTATTNTAPGGEITFGGVDTSRYSGNITYVDCVSDRPWTIPVSGLTVGNTSISVTGVTAAIDTGTTALLVPETVANAIHAVIPGAVNTDQGWFIPCSGNTNTTFQFGTFKGVIPYSMLAIQSTAQNTDQGNFCLSAAMYPTGETETIEQWLVGDAFLKNVYSVFDFSSSTTRIGFAQLGSGGTSSNGTVGSGSTANAATWTIPSTTVMALQALSVVSILFAAL
ncbi:hypothetical protein EMPS_04476 [Entomortierella parvispora]|uniref:Peptidase A1 domain-containing protein n=1 Tax=Entomortierella parvispora TaxID=205924 RepID=A0A9P3H8K5_9FUNG|nr:hypothetical protein EMPS_04476 [Entomortierella parvispora]